jgi:hypothetical protein
MTEFDTLRDRAEALHLHGLVSHWPEVATEAWVAPLLFEWEETQRACRNPISAASSRSATSTGTGCRCPADPRERHRLPPRCWGMVAGRDAISGERCQQTLAAEIAAAARLLSKDS